MKHGLGSGIGAWDGGKFGIGPVAIDGKHLAGRNGDILGKCPIEIRRHPDIAHRSEPVGPHAGPNKDTLAKQHLVTTRPRRYNTPAAIGALNDREWCRLVPATIILMLGTVLLRCRQIIGAAGDAGGVPAKPRVDFSVVHAGRKDPHQQLACRWNRCRHKPVIKLVIATIASGNDGVHFIRNIFKMQRCHRGPVILSDVLSVFTAGLIT